MNFPSSRLLRSSPLVPSRALFKLPSSFFFPPPSCFRFHAYQHKPLGRSTPLHSLAPPSFSSSSKEEGSQVHRTSKPRFFPLHLFLLPPSFCSSCSRIGPTAVLFRLDCPHRALLALEHHPPSTRPRRATSKYPLPPPRLFRVDHEPEATRIASSLPPLHLAALTPTGARCYVSRSARIVIPSSTFICDYCWNVTDRLVLIMGHHRFPLCFRGRWKEITTPFDSV